MGVETLIATILPIALPVIKSAIVAAENAFQGKPKSGAEKFSTVIAMVEAALVGLAKSALIPGVPGNVEVSTVVQSVFDTMNKFGQVNSPLSKAVAQAGRTLIAISGEVTVVGQL